MRARATRLIQMTSTALLISVLFAGAARAFVDERTIKPEPVAKQAPPARAPVIASPSPAASTPTAPSTQAVQTNAVKPGNLGLNIPIPEAPPVAAVTTKLETSEPRARVALAPNSISVKDQNAALADMSSPIWQGKYPGPFGTMRLSEALIAQVAPVSGGAIELDVPEKMLSMSVTINTGMTRQATLQDMAKVSKINVSISGKKVSARSLEPTIVSTPLTQEVATQTSEKIVEQINGMTITTYRAQGAASTPTPVASTASSAQAAIPAAIPAAVTAPVAPAAISTPVSAVASTTVATTAATTVPAASSPATNALAASVRAASPLPTSVLQASASTASPLPAIALPVITEPIKITKRWSLPAGTMLSAAMEKWAKTWGWRLMWKVDKDFRIASTVEIDDDFLGGIARVLDAYRATSHPLWGDAHEGQRLLVITAADGSVQGPSRR